GLGLLGYGLLCSLVASSLGFVLGHELALLGLTVECTVLVINLSAGVYPHHALGLGVGDFLRRRCGGRFDGFLLSAGLGLPSLCGGGLSHSRHSHRESGE